MRIRIQFLPDEFVAEDARGNPPLDLKDTKHPPFLKGQLVITYMEDHAPAPAQPHERCDVFINGNTLSLTPINTGGYIPRALKDDRVHEAATAIIRAYFAAKCGKIAYLWTEYTQPE